MRLLIAFGVLGLLVNTGARAHKAPSRSLPRDGVFWTTEAFLKDAFKESERVTFVQLRPSAEQMTAWGLKTVLREGKYVVVYVARSNGQLDGLAYISPRSKVGRFGVVTSSDGVVTRVDVLEFFDRNQTDILDPRFLAQLVGKSHSAEDSAWNDAYRPHHADRAARSIIRETRFGCALATLYLQGQRSQKAKQ